MSKTKNIDCLQVFAPADVCYEIDKSIRYLYGHKITNINRIPYITEPEAVAVAPSQSDPRLEKSLEKRYGKKKRKTPSTAGSGRLQTLIREALASGKKTQAELSAVARENDMSSGNTRRALDRMKARGEVRRLGKYWMRTQNGK